MDVVERITDLIGNTPMLKLRHLVNPDWAEVWLKLERFNPGGSVKDRPALEMVEQAEEESTLRLGMTIVEPTSGNTGIGLALVAAAKGYRIILVMPDSMTEERRAILAAYGATVVLTPGNLRMAGAVQKAKEILKDLGDDGWMPGQFDNQANPDAHRKRTALEVLRQTQGRLDALVAAAGTGGTVTGCGEVLKMELPALKVYVVEPKNSPVLSGGQPGAHKIVGTSPGFVPAVLNRKAFDKILLADDDEAIATMRDLAKMEGILVGISSGAVVRAALDLAHEYGAGKRIVAICPDSGERYLSMGVFEETGGGA